MREYRRLKRAGSSLERELSALAPEVRRNVVCDNAAKLYGFTR
jgi:hypothetical protein